MLKYYGITYRKSLQAKLSVHRHCIHIKGKLSGRKMWQKKVHKQSGSSADSICIQDTAWAPFA